MENLERRARDLLVTYYDPGPLPEFLIISAERRKEAWRECSAIQDTGPRRALKSKTKRLYTKRRR